MVVGAVTAGGSTQVRRHEPHLRTGRTGVLSLVVTARRHQTNRLHNQTQSRSYKARIHPQETIESKRAKSQSHGSDLWLLGTCWRLYYMG